MAVGRRGIHKRIPERGKVLQGRRRRAIWKKNERTTKAQRHQGKRSAGLGELID
jgi:hypothetical protein